MSILKFVFEENSTQEKPVGTKITHSTGKTYIKESTGWYNVKTGAKLNYKSSLILEANLANIRFEEKPDGYYLNGMKLTPEQAAPFAKYERYNGEWYNKETGSGIYREDSSKLSRLASNLIQKLYKENGTDEETQLSSKNSTQSTQQSEPSKQEQPEEQNKVQDTEQSDSNAVMYPDLEGRGYKIMRDSDGDWVHSGTGQKLSAKEAKPYEDRYKKEHGNDEGSESTEQEEAPTDPKQSEEPAQPKDSQTTDSTSSNGKDSESADNSTGNDQSTEVTNNIPNGYVYTSGKGNKFIYKNGTWFNLATKKPVNQSNVNMLNRSAEKAINDFNAKSDIKIGDKVKSGKGVEYTYNGTGFSSADGKQLTGGAAQAALNKLKAEKAGSTQDSGTDTSNVDAGTTDPKQDDTIVPGQSAVDTNPPEQQSTSSTQGSEEAQDQGQYDPNDYTAQSIINNLGDNGTGNSDNSNSASQDSGTPPSTEPSNQPKDPMTELAQKIKSSKYNKQIVTLLNRGGDMDLLAADILLNGNVQEVVNQLKSLNNSNTQ